MCLCVCVLVVSSSLSREQQESSQFTMDDDPFAVVAPSDKKMSTYLKRSKDATGNACVETSSQGTTSTRSTTNSTLSPEEMNFFGQRAHDQSSKKSTMSGFHNSNSSGGSANFDFGNGLEFGQGFGSSGFGDDGFGAPSQPKKKDRKPQSARNFSSEPDPFLQPSAPKSMRNFGSSSGDAFDAFGESSSPPSAPKSMRNFGSSNDDSFDAFGGGFGNDAFGSADPFQADDSGFGAFEQEDIKFDDDGFGMNAFAGAPEAEDDAAWKKREKWKSSSRSKSGDVPKRTQRRGGAPRRHHSSDDAKDLLPDDVGSPRPGSSRRPTSSRNMDSSSQHSDEGSKPTSMRRIREKSEHGEAEPARRPRGSRRASIDTSGHSSGKGDIEPPQPRRPPRRASTSTTSYDGSMDASFTGPPPQRTKSSTGPAHRPGAGRRQRRTGLGSTHSGNLELLQNSFNSVPSEGDKEKKWEKERSTNQEKIMEMYRGGGGLGSSKNDSKQDASISELGKHLDMMGLVDDSTAASGSLDESRSRRSKKKDKDAIDDDEGYGDTREHKDRHKGTLLDRVGGTSHGTHSSSGNGDNKSVSYSDRIMMAQQRSKRN